MIKLILFVIATIAVLPLFAQLSNLRTKKISTQNDAQLDSLSIVPNSIFITNFDTSFFSVDAINAKLFWKKTLSVDSVQISYRVFPTRLNAVAKRFSYDSVRNNFIAEPSLINQSKNNTLFNFGNLNYNGSFGRSLSFGNSQDAVFNSEFNLQINGIIGDSIQLLAAITDNNIPIQPEGTTQQLNDFDKVLLEFKKRNWQIDLGDIDLRQNQSYFLNFYKRLQGISYAQQFNINKNITNKTLLSGAIAKGKFARNILPVQEGNQGPYRLQGNNNELYFIVLAGTEKVFIDGVLMQRGEDQDYVINYNTAEITFTPKQLISTDKRVQVEFEYADRNYLNSMLYANNETDFGKKFKLNVSAYSNVDAKNSPIDQALDNNQKQFLANLGDSIQNAFYPVSSIDSFSTTAVMYKKIDTIYNGVQDSIYVYSTNADSAKYNLSFANVGLNKGNYVLAFSTASGNVFQWIPPLNGIPQGSFEAAAFLVTPKKQQLISVGGVYSIDDKTTIRTEVASSNYNVNTFSTKDKGNDIGYAGKINFDRKTSFQIKKKKYYLNTAAGYEWVDKNFVPVETLRPVEFARDWGLPLIITPATEKLSFLSLQLNDEKNNTLQYQFSSYIRSDGYKGYKNTIQHSQTFSGWQLNDVFSMTNFITAFDKGYYLRPEIDLNKTFSSFHNYTIGASYAIEHNETRNIYADTVTPLSYAFETLSAYLKSDQSKKNNWAFTYYTRSDQLPYQKNLVQTSKSNNYNLQTQILQNPHQQLRLTVTYRQFFVNNSLLTTQLPDNSLLGRAEYLVNVWNGFITGNSLYELGAGQEQKQSFSYVQVPAGQGQYTWVDYNKDGVPQLNEFVLAVYQDQATYIRIYTPTNEYVKADYNQFNYSLYINPKAIANSIHNKQFKNFITRFNFQSSLQTGKKQLAQGNPVFNPFKGKIQDTSLITLNYIVSNTLSFNRSNTAWGADFSNVINYNKSLLTYGFESRQFNEWSLHGRVNFARTYTFELIQKINSNNLFTPSFNNQNYELKTISTQPQITFISGTKFRIQTGYQFMQTKNTLIYGGEKSINNSLNIETKFNAVQNTSLIAKFTFSNINFNGLPNTTVSYVMLNGLLPGKNFLWTIDFTKRLLNNLELNFEYEGRKPGDSRTINTGRASLRALL
ncbi:MAG: hypothetical protein ACR2FN_12295 [Chitinophagaceae bacterium]